MEKGDRAEAFSARACSVPFFLEGCSVPFFLVRPRYFVRLIEFVRQGIQNVAVTAVLEVVLQPAQRYADDVAMVET